MWGLGLGLVQRVLGVVVSAKMTIPRYFHAVT